jgi:hypothetical protein
MQYELGHVSRIWIGSRDTDMQHGHGYAARTSTCRLTVCMSMLHILVHCTHMHALVHGVPHVYDVHLCPCFMSVSMSMLHVQVLDVLK